MPTTTSTDAPARPAGRRRAAALPPDERRSMIVEATIPLVLEHGPMITTRQIADAAGIAEGTIFRAFADKEELLSAVVAAALDPEPLERALASIDPALPLLDIVVQSIELAQRRIAEIWQLVSSLGPRMHDRPRGPMPDSPALARLLEPHRAELAVSPRAAARRLRAVTFALSHPMLVDKPSSPREVADFFLHGVTKRAPAC